MSEDIEKRLEGEIKACQEMPDGDVAREVARIYNLLDKLPERVKHGVWCYMYTHPFPKPIRDIHPSIEDNDSD